MIQDGNYVDFAVGERRRFALEFFDQGLGTVEGGVPSAIDRGHGRYEIVCQVAHATRSVAFIDFGLLAYCDSPPPVTRGGGWLAGYVDLAVDCFSYFEIHSKRRGVPPAVYAWTITGIWRQTAPFIPKPGSHLDLQVRDPHRQGYAPLDRTDAWADDGGYAEYLIRCRLEDEAPGYRP